MALGIPGGRDPLLRVTRTLLVIGAGLFLIAGVVALAAVVPVWVFGAKVLAWLAAHSDGHAGSNALLAICMILVVFAAHSGLTFQFTRRLTAIIDSVGQGSPFVARNAERLRAMAWLLLVMQAISLLVVPATGWFRDALGSRHFFLPFSFEGLIGALLLFILARVFDHGTRLAEDAEGTV